jgi:hypothetical protein
MISPIQFILIIPLALIILLLVVKLRNRTFHRLAFIAIVLLGIVFVIYPNLTNSIAALLGVGRGTDLILYFCIVAGILAMLFLYGKQRKIQETQTEIIRSVAIAMAKKISN